MNSSVIAKEKAGLGQRFDFWILERVRQRRGVTQLPLTFEYRHIYVMPTRFGFWFGMLLALTALGGLNFNNNMALMLGFLLASIAQLTTLLAYRNLVGITVCRRQRQVPGVAQKHGGSKPFCHPGRIFTSRRLHGYPGREPGATRTQTTHLSARLDKNGSLPH
jgi:hypothetical protein